MDKAEELVKNIIDIIYDNYNFRPRELEKLLLPLIRPHLMKSEWQSCPVCSGQGLVSRPAGIAGDVEQWVSGSAVHPCPLCNGKKIINDPLPEAPNE